MKSSSGKQQCDCEIGFETSQGGGCDMDSAKNDVCWAVEGGTVLCLCPKFVNGEWERRIMEVTMSIISGS